MKERLFITLRWILFSPLIALIVIQHITIIIPVLVWIISGYKTTDSWLNWCFEKIDEGTFKRV